MNTQTGFADVYFRVTWQSACAANTSGIDKEVGWRPSHTRRTCETWGTDHVMCDTLKGKREGFVLWGWETGYL